MVQLNKRLTMFSVALGAQLYAVEFFKLPVNLDDTSSYSSSFTGSTSCGMTVQVSTPGASGAFYPQCSATNPNTEVGYFRLATLLGYGKYVQAAAPAELGPDGIEKFFSAVESGNVRPGQQAKNCQRAKDAVERSTSNPDVWERTAGKEGWLPGVFKSWSAGQPVAYSGFSANNRINPSDTLVKLVQAGNSQPTDRNISAGGKSVNELESAKALSLMLTLDALFGQWDRYSGNNVQLLKKSDGNYTVFIADNGGALLSNGTTWVKRSIEWHSRYDRAVVAELRTIFKFLKDGGEYQGATSAKAFAENVLGFRGVFGESIETQIKLFGQNLKLFLDSVDSNLKNHGESKVFFSN